MSPCRRLLAVTLALALAACQPVRNPARGTVEYSLMTPEQARALAREEHPKVLARYGGAYDDRELSDYVARIGLRVAAASDIPDEVFTFTLLDSPVVNAFALPGYVYVTRGLLALADDEAELAAVLAHEIGHVAARHVPERQQQLLGAGLVALILGTLASAAVGGQEGELLGELASLGAAAYVAGFSREQEREADRLALRYLARAGYDPAALARILDALDGWERLQARLRGEDAAAVPEFLSTHPSTPARVRAARRLAARLGPGEARRDIWLDRLDGLVFGDGPKQGFVRGRRFVHPVLRFRFEAPPGFRLINRPDAVIGEGPGGRLLVFDMGEARPWEDPADVLAREVENRPVVRTGRYRTWHGYEAAVAELSLDGREAWLAVLMDEERRVFRFLYAAPWLDGDERGRFLGVLDSFRTLAPGEARRVPVVRLRVMRVPREGVRRLVRRVAVERLPLEHLLVLNHRRALRDFRPGERIKVPVRTRARERWWWE